MSTWWEYGNVSPAGYPNPTRKRKSSTATGTNPGVKKKKEKENHEVTCLSEIPHDETVEVLQEGVSCPQPSGKETKEAVQEVMNELSVMMDQATQIPPPPPPPPPPLPPTPEDDIEPFTRMVRFANMFRTPAEDYIVCPRHRVRLEERMSQKMGWSM